MMDLSLDLTQDLDSFDDEDFVWYHITEEEFARAREIHGKEREQLLRSLEGKRVELTAKQQALLEAVQEKIPEILERYVSDLPTLRKTPPAIIFLERSAYKEVREEKGSVRANPDTLGTYFPEKNTIVIWYKKSAWRDDGRNEEFVHTLSHELLHAYALRVLQVYQEKASTEPTIIGHRSGLHIWKLGCPEGLFGAVNEAITEDLAVEVTNAIVNEHREEFRGAMERQIEIIASRSRQSVVKMRAMELGFPQTKQRVIDQMFEEGYHYAYPPVFQSYPKERKLLQKIITTLCRRNPAYGGREDEVRRLFYEANFSRSMLKVGRLIEETFGKGTFRLLAEKPFSPEFEERLKPVMARTPEKAAFLAEHEQKLRALGFKANDL